MKHRIHRMYRYSNDLEKMRHADSHLEKALGYLRKSENVDRVMTLIAGVRRLRMQLEVVFENALPRFPGGKKIKK